MSSAAWKHNANCYRNHRCRCEICKASFSADQRRYRQIHGRRQTPARKESNRRALRKLYADRKASGLCIRCGQDSNGKRRCVVCADEAALAVLAKYHFDIRLSEATEEQIKWLEGRRTLVKVKKVLRSHSQTRASTQAHSSPV